MDDENLSTVLLEGSGYLLAYAGVGLVLFVIGFYLMDLATPGRLMQVIRKERNPNATLLASASLVGVGLITSVSIFASGGDLGEGLARTAVFGLVGIVAQVAATLTFDLLVGVSIRQLVAEQNAKLSPAAVLLAVANVMIGLVTAVAVY